MIKSFLLALDPRLKLCLGLCLGLCVWAADVWAVYIYFLLCAWLCTILRSGLQSQGFVLKSYIFFLCFWSVSKFILDIWSGMAVLLAAQHALFLSLRLAVLLLLALLLILSTSSRQLGMALLWFLRPIFKDRAWEIALMLALMLHFLPMIWQTIARVRLALRVRTVRFGFMQRMRIIAGTSVRVLGQKTWNHTLGVAARNLDRPEAWNPVFQSTPKVWGIGLIISFGLVAMALI